MKLWESLRRPDWLAELQAVLILGVVLVAGLGAFQVVRLALGDELTVSLPASAVSGTVDAPLRAGAEVASDQDLQVLVAEPSAAQVVASALTGLPSYLVVVTLLVLLLRLVRSARRDDPFTRATAGRLRVLAVVVLAGGYGAALVESLAGFYLSSQVYDGATTTLDVPLYWLLVGFGLLAVAEVVNRGRSMRAELETVV